MQAAAVGRNALSDLVESKCQVGIGGMPFVAHKKFQEGLISTGMEKRGLGHA